MALSDVRRFEKFVYMPRVAVYTFSASGKLLAFNPTSPFLAAELGLQPFGKPKLDSALGSSVAKFFGMDSIPFSIDDLVGGSDSGGFVAQLDKPAGWIDQGFPHFGVFAERTSNPSWVLSDGIYRLVPNDRLMVSIVHDNPHFYQDDGAGEFSSADYTKIESIVCSAVAGLGQSLSGIIALIHDLRGTLGYKGFYLAYSDFMGLQRLMEVSYKASIGFVGTVTSGTVGEGTNFLRWVSDASPDSYPPYKSFAICDSLTTAKLVKPEYDHVLVSGETVGKIRSGLEAAASGSLFPGFIRALNEWRVRDTENSVIIDLPPGTAQDSVEQVLREAELFRGYFRNEYGEDITVLSKSASTPYGTSTRLYLRPIALADGTGLTKGNSFAYYMAQSGIDGIDGRFVYFADNYGSPEEISIGGRAAIGFEVRKGETPRIEFSREFHSQFGEHVVPAMITVPNYRIAAEIMSGIFEKALAEGILPVRETRLGWLAGIY